MRIKAGQAVVDAIKLAYAARKPVLLEGRHGIGKSQLIEQAARELKVGCIVRDLSLMEPPDLIGLPRMESGRTCYAPPSFLPSHGEGLLVLEELNRSERYMMAPCLQLLTARTLNDYELPDGWLCVAAINPSSDGYDTTELDPALLSRFVHFEVVPCVTTWMDWAKTSGIHASVLGFVSQTPDIFEAAESNPRTWSYVSDVLKAYETQDVENENMLLTLVSGLVGHPLALAFLQSFLAETEVIPPLDVLENYGKKHRCYIRQKIREKRMDVLNATVHGVILALQDDKTVVQVEESAGPSRNLRLLIDDLPADMGEKLRLAAHVAGVEVGTPLRA